MALAAGAIDIVVLDEHRGGQHDIGDVSRLGHELLVHRDEEIVAEQNPVAPAAAPA